MSKENKPLLSEQFLEEVVREINQLYSGSNLEQNEVLDKE
ncbi:bacitracin ABC transporter ATP-binding protein [Neobacillus pocheonensis]|uniref:Bacitracin ABC transporter ATP-binding protein n=1 Tax=Neobacillus pocheonensis TaxID=363869 RepID=A0ABT0WAB4_9BACI|nr:bacitracin ABC transporter ATP-binding protein [Neobacillus pocheonensis]